MIDIPYVVVSMQGCRPCKTVKRWVLEYPLHNHIRIVDCTTPEGSQYVKDYGNSLPMMINLHTKECLVGSQSIIQKIKLILKEI